MTPPPATILTDLGLSDSALHAFAAALQSMVAAVVRAVVPSIDLSASTGKVATLSLLHLCFTCGVDLDGYLPPIWDPVARVKGGVEGIVTLIQALMRGLSSCCRFFIGRAHFSASLPLLAFVKKVSLMNPSLDPACTGVGGFTPWLTLQVSVKVSTCGGADAYLLAQQLDGRLASADSLQIFTRVCLDFIPSADKALRYLGLFVFVVLHLLSTGKRHSSAVAKLLHLIERLEELHKNVQGMISSPHLATTLLYHVSRRCSHYLSRFVVVSASQVVEAPGGSAPFFLEPILVDLEGVRYINPILPVSLANLVAVTQSAGGVPPQSCGGGSNSNGCGGDRNKTPFPKGGYHGGTCMSAGAMVCTCPHCPFEIGRTHGPF